MEQQNDAELPGLSKTTEETARKTSDKSCEEPTRKTSDNAKRSQIPKSNDNGRSDATSTPGKVSTPSTPRTSSMLPPSRPNLINKKRNSNDKGKPMTFRPKTPSRTGQANAVEKIVEKINQQSPSKDDDNAADEVPLVPKPSTAGVEPDDSSIKPDALEQTTSEQVITDVTEEEDDGWTPNDPIPSFEWDDLAQRHAESMKDFDRQEQEVMEDFRHTAKLFESWVAAGHEKDSERSSKRLKTRVAYIQHEEAELEQRRQHYIKVVRAFRDALELLEP